MTEKSIIVDTDKVLNEILDAITSHKQNLSHLKEYQYIGPMSYEILVKLRKLGYDMVGKHTLGSKEPIIYTITWK